ncbi:hypothetical protein UFOVP642_10 [uncultured Caudovirales phage]|uniref:Uncharacterized protein n=1 Tax=uncultured Caudovirales phage TaxID=2100421 RepID=A0A6J5NBY2_9CAUD|nr:hypothetical protein UFOVP642_10 [uncultured Caudovirales phage]
MATTYKVLGQSNPSAATLTTLYTVPAATSTVISTLAICNRSSTSTTYRVAIRLAGGAVADEDYIAYDSIVPGNDTVYLTLGIALATTDVVSIYATVATLSFNAFGSEIA